MRTCCKMTGVRGRSLESRGNSEILLAIVLALDDFAENRVPVVQPRRRRDGDEKLAAIGVRPGIGHGEFAGTIVAQRRMKLVGKTVARTAGAVARVGSRPGS